MRLRAGDPNNHGYVEPTPEEYAQMYREREARRQREREAYERFVNSDENREYHERLESDVRLGHYPHPPVAERPLPASLEAQRARLRDRAEAAALWAEMAHAERAEDVDLRFISQLGNTAPMVLYHALARVQRDQPRGADQVSTRAPSEAERSSRNS